MKKKNLFGIFALTMLASSFSSCTKTVYMPDSAYYDNMATNKPANKGSEGFYSSNNRSNNNNNNYRTAPSLIDRVNNNEYQRPDRPQARPMGDRVVIGPNQRPTTDVNAMYNAYPEVAIIEEVEYSSPSDRQVSQPVQVQAPVGRPQVQAQQSAPTPPPAQQHNYGNAPTTKKVNTPVTKTQQNTQQYYYNTPQANNNVPQVSNMPQTNNAPEVRTYSKPATTPVQQAAPFSQFFDQNVTISFNNGAKLDGIISKHPNSANKVIIKLADGATYEAATKDIAKVNYRY